MAIALASPYKRENFILDITRTQIKLTKATYQNRARQAIILMRLDRDGDRGIDGQKHPPPVLVAGLLGCGDVTERPAGRSLRVGARPVANLVSLMRQMRIEFFPEIVKRPSLSQNIFRLPIPLRQECAP